MKKAVKTVVDLIEEEIELIKENLYLYDKNLINERNFEFGTFYFEFEIKEISSIGGEFDEHLLYEYVKIEVKSIDVTNENNKTLTNLSNEVFNQLEENYTNY